MRGLFDAAGARRQCAPAAPNRALPGGPSTSPLGDTKGHHVDLRSVVLLGLVVSLVLSSLPSLVILPPTRALLRRLCPLEDTVAFWTRFTVLMLEEAVRLRSRPAPQLHR